MRSPTLLHRLRTRIFYGWWLVATGFTMQFLTALLIQRSYSAYVVLWRDQFGWSKTALSAGYSLEQVESGLLGPLQGWLADRFGARANMRVGVLMFGAGLMFMSQVNSLFTFYAASLTIALGTNLCGFFPVTVTIVNWFEKRRARALSTVSLGFAAGGLMVPVMAFFLDQFGWRNTAFASGIVALAVGLPLCQLVRQRPEPYGEFVDGIRPENASHAAGGASALTFAETDFTVKEAVRTPAFWLISLGHASALLIVAAVNVHVIAQLNEKLGYSLSTAALAVTMMTFFQVTGLLIGGAIGDRFDKRMLAMGCMAMHAVGLILLAYAVSFPMVVGFAVLHGVAWGLRGPLMQAIRADYFGRRSFGVIMGFSSMISVLGNISGPLIAGFLADATGGYETGFTILAVLAALGSVFFLLARRPPPPKRARPADDAALLMSSS
ncbi:MAG: MFS transporter [Dehalococcoidia bacterium]